MAVYAIAPTLPALGGTVLLDFEDEAQRKAMPVRGSGGMSVGCERKSAVGGEWSFALKPKPWNQGMAEWPSVNLPVSVTDWRPYDRLVVDTVNLGQSNTDALGLFICAPTGRVQNGFHASLPLTPGGFERWEINLNRWPKTCNRAALGQLHFAFTRPEGSEVYIDNITLYRKGETVPPPPPMYQAMKASAERAVTEGIEERQRALHATAYESFVAACAAAGQDGPSLMLGEATSMEKILPRGAKVPRALDPRAGLSVRLARCETEGVQLFVAPRNGDLRDVRVESSDLIRERSGIADWFAGRDAFAASNVTCRVTGYVRTSRPPPYKTTINVATNAEPGYVTKTETPEVGWWPDPILEYLDRTEVKGTDIQGFWIRVKCPADQRAGSYRGTLRLTATVGTGTVETVGIPFTVRVNDFAVPRRSPLPLAITFRPNPSWQHESVANLRKRAAILKDPLSPPNAWKRREADWGDFLADHYIMMDDLYHKSDGYDGFIHFDVLRRLADQGRLGLFNLGNWNYPRNLNEAGKKAWRKSTLNRLRVCHDRAKKLGLLDHAYIYGCDEVPSNCFTSVRWAAEELKRNFPDVPISTTAYDHDFGVGSPLSMIDWFTPLTPKFDPEKVRRAREAGHQVWWYICCGPHAPYANMFIECPAIEGRLLMGAQTVKYRPDGFLYYQISIWNAERPISTSSAFTDWSTRSWTRYNGDGSWTCCGPDGMPLSTVRLENFRDGLEDYAYALELERRLKANPSAPWAEEARRLLEVPREIVTSLKNFTDDPRALYRWRDRMADLIEQ